LSLERAQLGLLAAIAATCLVSIFAAQVLLSAALLVELVRLVRRRATLVRLPLDGPILAFCVWTLLSASFSTRPVASHESAKKLLLFALLYLAVEGLARAADRARILDAAMLGGLVLAAGAVLQYHFLGFDTLDNRPRSFLGHYMTASGLCMAVLVMGAARLAFGGAVLRRPDAEDWRRLLGLCVALGVLTLLMQLPLFPLEGERLFVAGLAAAAAALALSRGSWPGPATSGALTALAVGACGWALLLSRTRSAWLGTLAGLAVVAVLRAPRSLWLLPAGVAAILLLRPAPVIERLTLRDASSRDRYYLWQAGLDMVMDKPVFGQGPGMITEVYPKYRWPEAPNPETAHLHDNALQIAAERGLPCLAFWIWLVAAAMGDAYREARRNAPGSMRWCGAGALAVLTAIMAAGAFEYNFGDSEVLMFTLLASALPYACRLERARAEAAA
jgi:O-antigen ligase